MHIRLYSCIFVNTSESVSYVKCSHWLIREDSIRITLPSSYNTKSSDSTLPSTYFYVGSFNYCGFGVLVAVRYTLLFSHWGGYKLTAIFQTTFSNAFSWTKLYVFRLNFNEVFSKMSNWQSSIGSDNAMAPSRRQAIIWTNDVLGCRRIYASLGLNAKNPHQLDFLS